MKFFAFACFTLIACSNDTFGDSDSSTTDGNTSDGNISSEGGSSDGATSCNTSHAFAAPVRVPYQISSNSPMTAIPGVARLSADELTLYFDLDTDTKIYKAVRAVRGDPFVGKVQVVNGGGSTVSRPTTDITESNIYFEVTSNAQAFPSIEMQTLPNGTLTLVVGTATSAAAWPYIPNAKALFYITNDQTSTIRRLDLGAPTAQPTSPIAGLATAVVVDSTETLGYLGAATGIMEVRKTGSNWGNPSAAPLMQTPTPDVPTAISPDGCRLYYRAFDGGNQSVMYVAERL